MPLLETDVLAGLIARKHKCLLQLRELGMRQRGFIDGGQMTSLLDVLAVKQRILGDLQQIERDLTAFRGQDPETRRWRTPDDRRRCAAQLGECQRMLAEIIEQEKQSEHVLVRRRDEVAVQLQGVNMAGRARAAYVQFPSTPVSHLDLTSGK
jgi:hypothetical protein